MSRQNLRIIDQLCLKRIFSYVDETDRKSVNSVCKQWRSLSDYVAPTNSYALAVGRKQFRLARELFDFCEDEIIPCNMTVFAACAADSADHLAVLVEKRGLLPLELLCLRVALQNGSLNVLNYMNRLKNGKLAFTLDMVDIVLVRKDFALLQWLFEALPSATKSVKVVHALSGALMSNLGDESIQLLANELPKASRQTFLWDKLWTNGRFDHVERLIDLCDYSFNEFSHVILDFALKRGLTATMKNMVYFSLHCEFDFRDTFRDICAFGTPQDIRFLFSLPEFNEMLSDSEGPFLPIASATELGNMTNLVSILPLIEPPFEFQYSFDLETDEEEFFQYGYN